jgi:hypothetical protein
MPDFELSLAEGTCVLCSEPVTAPIDEVRITGIFVCACGALTRAVLPEVESRSLFRTWDADKVA